MNWSIATLQRDFMDLFREFYRTPDEQRDWVKVHALVARCAEHFQLLNRQLAGNSWRAGDRLSMADIPAATSRYRYFALEIERPTVPSVTAWYERVRVRAPYRRHVMIPVDDLRGRLQY